jgi:hypothetical protein
MSRNKEEYDFDVMKPSRGTNHLLDPTQVGGNYLNGPSGAKSYELGTDEKSRMMSRMSGDKSGDKAVKDGAALGSAFTAQGATSTYGIGTDEAARMQERLDNLKGWRKSVTPKADVRGGGPKSTLRTPRKMFSSFGRGVPFSGSVSSFFKSAAAGPAIGQTKHFIPNQGLFDMGISAGPRMLQGPKFAGAFPMFNIHQFNTAHAATPHDSEEED